MTHRDQVLLTGVGVFLLSVLLHTWALLVVVAQINRRAESLLADGETPMLVHSQVRPWVLACDVLSWPVGQSVCRRGPIYRFAEGLNSMAWGGAGVLVWTAGRGVVTRRRGAIGRNRPKAQPMSAEPPKPAPRRGSAQGHAATGAYLREPRRAARAAHEKGRHRIGGL